MAEVISTPVEVNEKLELLGKVWDKFGLATILVVFGLGVFTGWIPSPLSDLQAESAQHKVDTKRSLKEHRKQTRLMLEGCMDSKLDHKKDPKECLRIVQEAGQIEGQE